MELEREVPAADKDVGAGHEIRRSHLVAEQGPGQHGPLGTPTQWIWRNEYCAAARRAVVSADLDLCRAGQPKRAVPSFGARCAGICVADDGTWNTPSHATDRASGGTILCVTSSGERHNTSLC